MKKMNTPGTLAFVLRWHFAQFAAGLALLALGVYGFANYTPDPPDAPYQSLVGMLGPWPYLIGAAVGAFNAVRAWRKGARLRTGSE